MKRIVVAFDEDEAQTIIDLLERSAHKLVYGESTGPDMVQGSVGTRAGLLDRVRVRMVKELREQ